MIDDVDRPEVVAEVRAVFEQYETALVANDVNVLDELFWKAAGVVRYGLADVQHGWDAVSHFRRGLDRQTPPRRLLDTAIRTFGSDLAVVATEFESLEDHTVRGRQSQTWVRFSEGWRVVAAHVSPIPPALSGLS